MPTNDSPLLNRIGDRFPDLSPSHRTIARYLAEDPRRLAFGTVRSIALATGASEATVVRLARALGYPGFVEMQAEGREYLSPRLLVSLHQRIEGAAEQGTGILARIAEADVENIRAVAAKNTDATLTAAAEMLVQSREVFVAGARTSYGVAHSFAFSLENALGHVTLLEPGSANYHTALGRLNEGACLVAFAFPRYSRWTYDVLAAARAGGCRTLVFTDSPLSPPGRLGEVVLEASPRSPAAIASYAAVFSLTAALLSTVALVAREQVRANLTHLEEVYARWNVYVNEDEPQPKQRGHRSRPHPDGGD